ncbi:MAG: 3-dehydroquinate synthase [Alphaproteobacteria bacterium]|nr:3-dehydroquinate synthase [Alphaproteobacteria bacterium]
MTIRTVHIDLGDRRYDISIGRDVLADVIRYLPFQMAGKKAFVVTDENVEPYARRVEKQLLGAGASFCDVLVLPAGEATKSYEHYERVLGWMLEHNIHRGSMIFAVGGGVIGDLAGFAAASVLRGVPFVQIPTTLLSQVDSSVGGKTGINTPQGKNLVGAFYQPLAVIADTGALSTLSKREFMAGYAEVVKYGLLGDLAFFEWLEANGTRVCAMEDEALSHAIEVSCRAKAAIVQADERESGARALLNLGHTFGHALEAAAGYDGRLLHGEAVAIGMMMAFEASVRMGLCPASEAARVRAHFEDVGLPINPGAVWGAEDEVFIDSLVATMKRDKKASDDKMTFVLVRGIGQAFVTQDVEEELVRSVLRDFFKD